MSGNGRILVVDDDPQIRRVLRTALVGQGYEVWDARRGDEALDLVRTVKFDLILLDLNLPDMSGVDVCRQVRAGFSVPIIALTVRSTEKDKVAALDAGANDYVTKPFDTSELLARVRAHLRRNRPPVEDVHTLDDLTIDFSARVVTRQGNRLHLAPKEYQLLAFLFENRGKPVSHSTLLRAIWGPDYGEETMLLQAHIARLRKKIERDPRHPRYIVTIPWVGYRFD